VQRLVQQISAHANIEYVMPPLSNSRTATEERRLLCGPCRDVINRTVSEYLVSLWSGVSWLLSE
jgi:hypothetical protein